MIIFILLVLLIASVSYIYRLENQRMVILNALVHLIFVAHKDERSTKEVVEEFVNNLEHMPIREYNILVKLLCKMTKVPVSRDCHSLIPASQDMLVDRLSIIIDNHKSQIEASVRRNYDYERDY